MREVSPHCGGAAFTQGEVVLRGATLIRVALHLNTGVGIRAQPFGVPHERILGRIAQRRLIELKINGVHHQRP